MLNAGKKVSELRRMTVGELRREYAEVFGEPTRSFHKEFLIRRIAWRLQANAEGGLPERAQRIRERALAIANDADIQTRAPGPARLPTAPLFGTAFASGAHLVTPPELRPGRDICQECGMLINEDRCSAAILIDDAGLRRYEMFDDIGCLLDREPKIEPPAQVLQRFVHDHATRAWLDADGAWYLFTQPTRLHTPMGSGMVAFASRADADAARAAHGGRVLAYSELPEARTEWVRERAGSVGVSASPSPRCHGETPSP